MKIEKVNDHQIRCTLTKADLADREIKLSELAYGTEKAKNLFRDMMQQAAIKFGFEAENIPLMIEAIPLNSDCIVLIITKVEDPEELDTRFSRFAPSSDSEDDEEFDDYEEIHNHVHEHNEVMDLFKKIKEETTNLLTNMDKTTNTEKEVEVSETPVKVPAKIFSFETMSSFIDVSRLLKDTYDDVNSLYKDANNGKYLLVLNKDRDTTENFNKACNIISEYSTVEKMIPASECYFKEHFDAIIEDNAIQTMSNV